MQTPRWQKKLRQNRKTWLPSLFMALTLFGGGAAPATAMIYPHVLNRGGLAVRSPLDV
jgi:hypothetical protein